MKLMHLSETTRLLLAMIMNFNNLIHDYLVIIVYFNVMFYNQEMVIVNALSINSSEFMCQFNVYLIEVIVN